MLLECLEAMKDTFGTNNMHNEEKNLEFHMIELTKMFCIKNWKLPLISLMPLNIGGLYPSTFADLCSSWRIEFYGHCSWRFVWGALSPPCGVQEQCHWKLWQFHQSQVFKQPFRTSLGDRIFSFFRSLLACARLTWWFCLPITTH